MPVRADLPPETSITVSFSAPTSNKGSAAVASGWKGTEERDTQESFLLPGGTATHTHRSDEGSALVIHFDIPHRGGVIDVEVLADTTTVDEGRVTADSFWTHIVDR